MTFWPITGDMVPRQHRDYVEHRTYRPYGGPTYLMITPGGWQYGATLDQEVFHASNEYAARETLSAYSDNDGGNCADHVTIEAGMLCVPLWADDVRESESGYHPAAIVGMYLLARMEDYPLLDESDYSEREWEAWNECLADEFRWIDNGERKDEDTDKHLERFLALALEELAGYYSVGDIPAGAIKRAYAHTLTPKG